MPSSDSQNSLASSFTDLMTSLAVIFILLLCVTHNEAQQEGENTRNSILTELRKELKDFIQQGVKVDDDKNDPLGLLILVPEGLLEFERNRDEIPGEGIDFLQPFIPLLANIVCNSKFRDEINSIVVEGHTDSSGPENMDKDQYNWNLSQRRSMAVVSQSIKILNDQQLFASDGMNVKDYFVKMLSASGRGSAELEKNNDGIENPGKSRRVIFKIRVRSLEQRIAKEFIK